MSELYALAQCGCPHVEKALSELHFHHPPTAVLNEVEIALSKMVKEVVLAGNAPLNALLPIRNVAHGVILGPASLQ